MKKSLLFLGVLSLGLAHAQQDVNGKVGVNIDQPKATLDIAAHKQDGTTKEGILIPRFEKAKVVKMTNDHRTTLEESTLLYVTDEVAETDKNTFEGTGKGFYYFDKKGQTTADNTARWVKVGASANAGNANPVVDTNLYMMDGQLTSVRTVTQDNKNLTFVTGSDARFIVDGAQQNDGPMFVAVDKNFREYNGAGVPDYRPTDYMVLVTNPGINGKLQLPDATQNKGRIIYIINGLTQGINFDGNNGTETTTPFNFGTIAAKASAGFVSSGKKWYPLGR